MKKFLSILLAAMLLCGTMGVGLTAAAAPAPDLSLLEIPLKKFLADNDLEDLTDAQVNILMELLKTAKKFNLDYVPLIDAVDSYLPFTVKAALHKAGLMDYPIWERDAAMHFVFKYLLFGWIWMDSEQFAFSLLTLFA